MSSRAISKKPTTRATIEDAIFDIFATGEKVTHDSVAQRAGVARRTVYRYFPDQAELMQAVWRRLNVSGSMPQSVEELLKDIGSVFQRFDALASTMTVALATLEGRAMRNSMKQKRVEAYRSLLVAQTAQLPEPDRTGAIAVIQLLNSGLAWREMHDQWDMSGPDMAVAATWAIRTLLADLERRGSLPLQKGPVAGESTTI